MTDMSGNRLENDDVREKLAELTDEELEQVTGGFLEDTGENWMRTG